MLLVASAIVSVIVSFFDAGWGMLAYLLNMAAPLVKRVVG